MSYDVTDSRAEDAMKAITKEFVDLNELRVATDLEIQEMLGVRYPAIEQRVAMITQCLNDIFEREHTMSLDRLKTVSKRDARQFLRELPGIHPFVEAYIMLFAFDGNAFPLDEEMLVLFEASRKSSMRRRRCRRRRNSWKITSRATTCTIISSCSARPAQADGAQEKSQAMTDRLPTDTLRLGLPSGSLQQSTIELFGRAGYRINIAERSVFPRIDDEKLSAVLFRAQEISRYVVDNIIDCGLTGYD